MIAVDPGGLDQAATAIELSSPISRTVHAHLTLFVAAHRVEHVRDPLDTHTVWGKAQIARHIVGQIVVVIANEASSTITGVRQ